MTKIVDRSVTSHPRAATLPGRVEAETDGCERKMAETAGQPPKARAGAARPQIARHGLHSVSPAGFLGRLRYQVLFGLLLTVVLPPLIYFRGDAGLAWTMPESVSTAAGTVAAFIIAIYLFRRVVTFPGVGTTGHVFPAVTAGYGLVLAAYFGLRLDYSRLIFGISFGAAILFLFLVSTYLRNRKGQRFYVVPSTSTAIMPAIDHVEWVMLKKPSLPHDPRAVLIADLRAELGPEWERLIADTAVAGHPVYHIKQVQESLTGRVDIEHLSENSFGSLIPNLSYRKIKRAADLTAALVLLPLFFVLAIFVALAIRLESPGPVFFRQLRRGYRGCTFKVVKFRTMSYRADFEAGREEMMTRTSDVRITRVGRFLRRTRIDELPQIWNILMGEMSWIGPRPEAISLSEWYEAELPFYAYRHIVRPGISGWAQVNQGHVTDLESVHEKLHYDFYYIKNFSVWLDLLILGKTIATVLSGQGAK
jgi:lipopolysaccharide/colanic/teichoic acid biosynthesis glycosyltransferase